MLEPTIQGFKKSRKPEKWGGVGVKWLKKAMCYAKGVRMMLKSII